MIKLFRKPLQECLLRIAEQEGLSAKKVKLSIYNKDAECTPLFYFNASNGSRGMLTFKQILNIKTFDPFARETLAMPKLKNAFKSEAEIQEINPNDIIFEIFTPDEDARQLNINIIHKNSVNRVCTLEEIMGLD